MCVFIRMHLKAISIPEISNPGSEPDTQLNYLYQLRIQCKEYSEHKQDLFSGSRLFHVISIHEEDKKE